MDTDQTDTHTYTVNDSRFEVVDAKLKLKSGQSLNYEAAASITIVVTAHDPDGGAYGEAFTITISDVFDDPANPEPEVNAPPFLDPIVAENDLSPVELVTVDDSSNPENSGNLDSEPI